MYLEGSDFSGGDDVVVRIDIALHLEVFQDADEALDVGVAGVQLLFQHGFEAGDVVGVDVVFHVGDDAFGEQLLAVGDGVVAVQGDGANVVTAKEVRGEFEGQGAFRRGAVVATLVVLNGDLVFGEAAQRVLRVQVFVGFGGKREVGAVAVFGLLREVGGFYGGLFGFRAFVAFFRFVRAGDEQAGGGQDGKCQLFQLHEFSLVGLKKPRNYSGLSRLKGGV